MCIGITSLTPPVNSKIAKEISNNEDNTLASPDENAQRTEPSTAKNVEDNALLFDYNAVSCFKRGLLSECQSSTLCSSDMPKKYI